MINTPNANIQNAMQFAKSFFEKNTLKITSAQRKSLGLVAGQDPFYIFETDTKKVWFWNGSNLALISNDPGVCDMNVLRLASNVADEETVTIDGTVYEFDRAETGVTAGRIAVTEHADDTPAEASTALAALINGNSALGFSAIRVSANEIIVLWKIPGAFAKSCTETLAGSNNAWASATSYGGRAPSAQTEHTVARVPKAVEVALGRMEFIFDSPPTLKQIRIYITATPGIVKAWDGGATVSGNRLILTNAGDVGWAATDTVVVTVAQ